MRTHIIGLSFGRIRFANAAKAGKQPDHKTKQKQSGLAFFKRKQPNADCASENASESDAVNSSDTN